MLNLPGAWIILELAIYMFLIVFIPSVILNIFYYFFPREREQKSFDHLTEEQMEIKLRKEFPEYFGEYLELSDLKGWSNEFDSMSKYEQEVYLDEINKKLRKEAKREQRLKRKELLAKKKGENSIYKDELISDKAKKND